jgi:NADH dehydrogenase FAD-containing subunit
LLLADGEPIAYDFLVLAAGAGDSYFGHPEWQEHAPGLKSLEEADEIRNRVLYAFEAAERETHPTRRRAWLTFVVVGGGPTGVELAGALAEIAFHTLARDFRRIDLDEAQVILIEGGDRLLLAYSPPSSASAKRQLERLGVRVRTGVMVTHIDAETVCLGAERIETRTKIWAAGVQASPLTRSLGLPLDRGGRVRVAPDLSLPGHPEVFAIGDLCSIDAGGKPVPGVAPAATQAGRHAGASILRLLQARPTEPFHYVDKGSLATIGRSAAVAEIFGLRLSGFLAWLAWLGIHIFFLIGFRNRVLVLDPVGVGLPDLPARRAHHHGRAAGTRRSDVEIGDADRALHDELKARRDLAPHQRLDRGLGCGGIVDRHLEHGALARVERGLLEGRGVHLAEPLEALDLRRRSALVARDDRVALLVVARPVGLLADVDAEERRHREVEVAAANQLRRWR